MKIRSIKKILKPLEKEDFYKVFFLLIIILLSTILELVSITLLIPILTIFVGDDYLKFTEYLYFLDFENKIEFLSFILFSFLIIYFLKLSVVTSLLYYQTRFSFNLYTKISRNMFNKYLYEKYIFHLSSNSSNLIRNVISESNMYSFGLILPLIKLISDLVIFFSISCLLIYYNILVSLIAIIFLIISSFIIMKITSYNLKTIGKSRQFHSGKMIKQVSQGLGNIKEVILYNLQYLFLKKFSAHNEEYAKSGKIKSIIIDLPRIILEFVIVLIFLSAIFFLIQSGEKISEIIVILGVFAFASFRLLPTIVKIIKSFQTIKYNLPVLDLISGELQKFKAKTTNSNLNKINDHFKFKNLEVQNLSYIYKSEENNEKVLSNVNLKINTGDRIGIIGKTGSGKTTLINLIVGLLDNYEGEIRLNNSNLNEDKKNFQNKIGYVPQNVYLADESIQFNITLDEEKNINFEKLSNVLKVVELFNFIEEMPNKIKTFIGERGSKLSGGQIQRIGIARALYREPSVLIFDEATSGLDEETENKILEKIFDKNPTKTIIVISHRKNSFKFCNKIYEIKDKNLSIINE